MRVAIAGSTGLVGTRLVEALRRDGASVVRLVREETDASDGIRWDPAAGEIRGSELEGLDALVNLAGRSIAASRWTRPVKRSIWDSRIRGTALLARSVAALERPPRVWINASAIGFYGDRGDEWLDESSTAGEGFLARLCTRWEAETEPAREAGVRVVLPRFGLVLAGNGGALARMLPIFRGGLGGRLGSGRQYMSWIGLDDLVDAIRFAIENDTLEGPVNAVGPRPVTNAEFTRELAGQLHRPAWFPAPAFALRLVLGEMADELLLASQRVKPAKLVEAGFAFRDTWLASALSHELDRG